MVKDTWCDSCGSRVPEGYDTCPVCGMPQSTVAGTREPSAGPAAQSADQKVEAAARGIEQEHPKGTKEQRISNRLVLLAGCVAIALVGGAALIITRPWDPHAYSISATEDADTSMSGYPGKKQRLTQQDRSEESQYLLINELDVLIGELEREPADEELRERAADTLEEAESLQISDSELAARRDRAAARFEELTGE